MDIRPVLNTAASAARPPEKQRSPETRISQLGLGTATFARYVSPGTSLEIARYAIEAGITFFDTADIYGRPRGMAETLLGRAVGEHRDKVVIATKVGKPMYDDGPGGASAGYLTQATEASLRRLRTEYVDLIQLHAPAPGNSAQETAMALSALVDSGKARFYGLSNVDSTFLRQALAAAEALGLNKPATVQNRYNVLNPDDSLEVRSLCSSTGVGFIPHSPYAMGYLAERYDREIPTASRVGDKSVTFSNVQQRRRHAVRQCAREFNVNPTWVALAWLVVQPVVRTIPVGASTAQQVDDNLAALEWSRSASAADAVEHLCHLDECGYSNDNKRSGE